LGLALALSPFTANDRCSEALLVGHRRGVGCCGGVGSAGGDALVDDHGYHDAAILGLATAGVIVSDFVGGAHGCRSQDAGHGDYAGLLNDGQNSVGAFSAELLVQRGGAYLGGIALNFDHVARSISGLLDEVGERVTVLGGDGGFAVGKVDGDTALGVVLVKGADAVVGLADCASVGVGGSGGDGEVLLGGVDVRGVLVEVAASATELVLLFCHLGVHGAETGVDLERGSEGIPGKFDFLRNELVIGVVGAFDLDVEAGDESGDAEFMVTGTEEASTLFGGLGGVGEGDGEAW